MDRISAHYEQRISADYEQRIFVDYEQNLSNNEQRIFADMNRIVADHKQKIFTDYEQNLLWLYICWLWAEYSLIMNIISAD
jgi:hypothetical protein